MTTDDRCPRCDRAECRRDATSKVYAATLTYESRHEYMDACDACRANELNLADWRARAKAAEAREARLRAALVEACDLGMRAVEDMLPNVECGDDADSLRADRDRVRELRAIAKETADV